MAETKKNRVITKGAENFRVFKRNPVTGAYGEGYHIDGLVNVDITFTQTTDKKAAEDNANYRTFKAPATGDGTVQFMGMSKADFIAVYSDITDKNGVINFGSVNGTQSVGFMYDEMESYLDNSGVEHISTNRMVIYDAQFSIPSVNGKTLEEGNTDVKEYSLSVSCSSVKNGDRQSAYAIINSVDDATQFASTNTAMYVLPSDSDLI